MKGLRSAACRRNEYARRRPSSGPHFLALNRAPADVAAAEASRPVDLVDGGIGARLRLANVAAQRGDAEHAPAVGEDAAAIAPGPGMEDLHARLARSLVEALDLRALGVSAGIALGRHDHAQRRLFGPFERDAVEPPLGGGEQRRQEIGVEPQHQRLAFRIAEADIVFDELWRAVLDHQPGIEHALERRAGVSHRAHRRLDDLRHDAAAERGRHDRRRRVGAHAAGVGALSPS